MIRFRQRNFSHHILSGAIKGGIIGGAIGGGSANLINGALPRIPKFKTNSTSGIKFRFNNAADFLNSKEPRIVKDKNGNVVERVTKTKVNGVNVDKKEAVKRQAYVNDESTRKMITTGAGMIIGAALGALVAGIREISNKMSSGSTKIGRIASKLKSQGFKEGKDYTLDPNTANRLNSKICIVLSKDGSGNKFLINTKNDQKLSKITNDFLKTLKSKDNAVVNQTASDRFNEIKIATTSESKKFGEDTIFELLKTFIREGFPVYLIELN